MSPLAEQVKAMLAEEGLLAAHWPDFKVREGQQDMACAVSDTLTEGGTLVVEAGTGVGKTFAYLLPVLLSGQRALVSTATKALQDQLYARDLPRLIALLNLPIRLSLLKGRSSYLCLHRMEQARHHPQASQKESQRALARVEQWALVTRSGDMAELSGLDEAAQIWPLVTSTRENCLGSVCPRYKSCHVNLARKEAMAADVVVINHHLFFADLAVRESGVAELLPTVRVTVFDEAHQLNEIGVNFLGQELSTLQLLELARDALGTGLTLARGLLDWHALHRQLETATRDWRLVAGAQHSSHRLRWQGQAPQGLTPTQWAAALQSVSLALQELASGLDQVTELAPDFVRLLERCQTLQRWSVSFVEPPQDDVVRWIEVGAALRVVQSPLDVADTFARLTQPAATVQDPLASGQARPVPVDGPVLSVPRAWVFTSATLGDDDTLRWFTAPCGLDHARTLRVDSPFDYARQAGLYVPLDLPAPGSPGHAHDVARRVLDAALVLGGRTLVLTTTLGAMRSIGEYLQQHMPEDAALQVLVQGQGPKRQLMSRFREGAESGRGGCILVGSATFWEGFDVPGDALQLVVIDKLPFSPPDDPVHEARSERLRRQGRQAFRDLALPEAAVRLKQGAGRLIRSETDRGLLLVCDPRLQHKGYGRRLLAALPPMQWISDESAYANALAALRQPSPKLPPGL